jgi:hypothetical protein
MCLSNLFISLASNTVSKKSYPLRINEQVLAALQRWADDDLRSLNAQIEYVLRDALVKSGRVKLVQKVITDVEPLVDIDPISGDEPEID